VSFDFWGKGYFANLSGGGERKEKERKRVGRPETVRGTPERGENEKRDGGKKEYQREDRRIQGQSIQVGRTNSMVVGRKKKSAQS